MREFSNKITFVKNFRGVWELDTSKGCCSGIKNNTKGCYDDCYAARYSKKYGYDFSKTILRYFENGKHIEIIINKINKIELPFIRLGVSGDPSENWDHTLNICEELEGIDKTIVIITKHWNILSFKQLHRLSKLNVCVNTSISALDYGLLLSHKLSQYNTLKNYCNSVLRILSCDFNKKNILGKKLGFIQSKLFDNEYVLDTIFRVSKQNKYVLDGIINIEALKFLGKKCYVSRYNNNTYFGNCSNCLEKWGLNV